MNTIPPEIQTRGQALANVLRVPVQYIEINGHALLFTAATVERIRAFEPYTVTILHTFEPHYKGPHG